jgi:hypothetical protein
MNPYWDELQSLVGEIDVARWSDREPLSSQASSIHRQRLVTRYAWAIPSPEVLDFVRCWSGIRQEIVEVGAGTGYWAAQLSALGVDVVAYDRHPPATRLNRFHSTRQPDGSRVGHEQWFDVQEAGPHAAARWPHRTLLLSWPPHGHPMAAASIRRFRGDRLIYIGEPAGGNTGGTSMHTVLAREWAPVASIAMTQWHGLNDALTVFDRVSP